MELAAQRRRGWLKEYVNKLITLVQKPGNESGNGTRRGEQSDVYFMNADGSNQRKLFQAHGVTRGRSESQGSLAQEGPRFTAQGALQRLWSPRRELLPKLLSLVGHSVFVKLIHYTDRDLTKRDIGDCFPVAAESG